MARAYFPWPTPIALRELTQTPAERTDPSSSLRTSQQNWLDGKHTVFGKVTKGQDVVNAIKQGDKIKAIAVEGKVDLLFEKMKKRIDEWNKVLDSK